MNNFVTFSQGCAKGLLLGLNFLCILVALCTFGFAVVDMKILQQYGEQQAGGSYTGDVMIVAACMLMVVVAILGIVGTASGSAKTLYLYIGLVMMIIVLELLIAIFVALQRYGLQYKVTDWIREDFFKNITEFERESHELLWDELQTTYTCCGLNGPEDYVALGQVISLSCCPRAYRAPSERAQKLLYKSCILTETYNKAGCEEEIMFILQTDADWLIGIAVISFWFEALGIVLAMWVLHHLKDRVQVYKHTIRY